MKYNKNLEKVAKIIEELYWSSDYDRMSACGQKEIDKVRNLLMSDYDNMSAHGQKEIDKVRNLLIE